jgi:hypothetical protein
MSQRKESIFIFISYADEDKRYYEDLSHHLSALKNQVSINIWHEGEILPGSSREAETIEHLNNAHIILLLISPDFMSTYSHIIQRALERKYRNEAEVIPIYLRHVYWQGTALEALKALPNSEKPITQWRDKNFAYVEVVKGISRVLKEGFSLREKVEPAPEEQERSITIHMETITKTKPTRMPDYSFDWLDYFVDSGRPGEKGHQLKDPKNWHKLLHELYAVRNEINQETTCRLIKAGGKSRLSPWFAFGFIFSSVADYTIEIEIPTQQWRTDAEENPNFSLIVADGQDPLYGETLTGLGNTVAIGISLETTFGEDVQRYLQEQQNEQVNSLLLVHTNPAKLNQAGDAIALANQVKRYASAFVKQHAAQRLLLFYRGPVSGACFIGHRLNKVCREIQIMEYEPAQGYIPSFCLTS